MTPDLVGVRERFPALRPGPDGRVPAYLDSACMSLVPQEVLDAMTEYYTDYPGCAGRSLHRFAEEVSHRFEAARETFGRFLETPTPAGIVFVRNSTEAINIVGQGISWKRGDRVLVSDQEHNSNLVLWQRLGPERGVRLEILRLKDDGTFDSEALETALGRGVRLVSLFHTSNLDGRSLPVREITERAHDHGALVLFDGCQAAPHRPVHLERDGIDFYAISAHKMLGPTGTGVLAGRPEALAELRPLVAGGETVEWSTLTEHKLRPPPHRFEAGLQNYAGVLGAAVGVKFLQRVGLENVEAHDRALNARVTDALADEPRIQRLGPADPAARPSVFAFAIDGVDPHDAALFLDEGHGVMVRSGRHCVHSWYAERALDGNVRASFYLYTDESDADRLIAGVRELLERIPSTATGTSAAKPRTAGRRAPSRRRASGSSATAARSARPRGRAVRGRAGSSARSG
jgi:cysteine desulfurase / selenocysteine lyase